MSVLARTRAVFGAFVAGWLALHAAPAWAVHPTGPVKPEVAQRVGVPGLQAVECLACHVGHGAGDDQLLEGRDRGAAACLQCHKAIDGKTHAGVHPLHATVKSKEAVAAVQRLGGVLGAKNTIVCGSCHASHASSNIIQRCIACHPEEAPVADAEGKKAGHRSGVCLECHNIHPGVGKAPVARATVEGDPKGCLRCHGEGGKKQPVDARPGTLGHALVDREGGFGPSDPKLEGCPTCHGEHEMIRPDAGLCEQCHDAQAEDHTRGGHGSATCLDCHPPHETPALHADAPDHAFNPVSRRCLACHAEDATVEASVPRVAAFEHPAPVFLPDGQRWSPPLASIPLFDPNGKVQPPTVNGDLTCASCHLSHGPDIDKPGDSLRRPGWEEACSACHGDNALLFYRWFHYRDRLEKTK